MFESQYDDANDDSGYEREAWFVGPRANDRNVREHARRQAINPQHLQLKSLSGKLPDYVQLVPGVVTETGGAVYRNYKVVDTAEGQTFVAWLPSAYKDYRLAAGVPGQDGPEEVLLQTPGSVASAALDAQYRQGPRGSSARGEPIWATVTTIRTNEKFTVAEVRLDM